MEHTLAAHGEHHDTEGKKLIWRTFWILLILTIVELALGYWMIGMEHGSMKRNFVKGAIIILMLAKAFYIVGYFMHLKHEIRNLIMTIVIPLALLVWGIIAFLYDGNAFRNNRNTYDPYKKEVHKAQPTEENHNEHKPEEKKGGEME